MRIITGDECGILKESIPELSRSNEDAKGSHSLVDVGVSRLGDGNNPKMSRTRGVVDLAFCQLDSSSEDIGSGSLSFCAFRADGSLEKWEGFSPFDSKEDRICGGTYKLSQSVSKVFHDGEKGAGEDEYKGRPIALCSAHQYQTFSTDGIGPRNIVTCCSSTGLVSVVNADKFENGVVATYDVYSKGKKSNASTISYTKGKFINRDIATAMAMSFDVQKVVVGGRERAATMIDVESGVNLWKAKNLPPNPQTLLQQPIWPTAIQFLSTNGTTPINGSSDLLAIGSAYKQLQIFDIRTDATQRRPVLYTPEWDSNKENVLEQRITSLCQIDSNKVVIGDSAGYIHTLDLRKISNKHGRSLAASVGRFNGPAGSVRQIIKHETLPIIACVGLDRMMRTFDIRKKKQIDCVYLKQRLNCMLFCSDGTWDSSRGSLDDDDDDDDDDNEGSESYQEEEVEGNIDDEDEVEDYINSSDEDSDQGSLSEESDTASSEENAPKSKRRRK